MTVSALACGCQCGSCSTEEFEPQPREPMGCGTWGSTCSLTRHNTHRDVVGIYVAVFLLVPRPPEADPALRIWKTWQALPQGQSFRAWPCPSSLPQLQRLEVESSSFTPSSELSAPSLGPLLAPLHPHYHGQVQTAVPKHARTAVSMG